MKIINILDDIKTTYQCRFEECRRLEERIISSQKILIILTFLAITLSIIAISKLGEDLFQSTSWMELIKLIALSISIIAMAFHLFFRGLNLPLKARELHLCAIKLKDLYHRLSLDVNNNNTDRLNKYIQEYHHIISSCPYNHSKDVYEYIKNRGQEKSLQNATCSFELLKP